MLQWGWSEISVHHMTGLLMNVCDPLCKLCGITNGGRQEHMVNVVREQYNGFFPHHAWSEEGYQKFEKMRGNEQDNLTSLSR